MLLQGRLLLGPITPLQNRRAVLHAPQVSRGITLDLCELDGAFIGWRASAPIRALAIAASKSAAG